MSDEEQEELQFVEEVCTKAKKEGKLVGTDIVRLYQKFDQRFIRALTAVRENRVRLHLFKPSGRKLWTVKGEHGEYLILPKAVFCSCGDFYFQIQKKMIVHLCYHLIAQKIATAFGIYETIEYSDEEHAIVLSKYS